MGQCSSNLESSVLKLPAFFSGKAMMKARIRTAFAKNNKKDYVFTLLVSKADMRYIYSEGFY